MANQTRQLCKINKCGLVFKTIGAIVLHQKGLHGFEGGIDGKHFEATSLPISENKKDAMWRGHLKHKDGSRRYKRKNGKWIKTAPGENTTPFGKRKYNKKKKPVNETPTDNNTVNYKCLTCNVIAKNTMGIKTHLIKKHDVKDAELGVHYKRTRKAVTMKKSSYVRVADRPGYQPSSSKPGPKLKIPTASVTPTGDATYSQDEHCIFIPVMLRIPLIMGIPEIIQSLQE